MVELTLINPPALIERPPLQQSGTLFIPERMQITAMNPGILSIASYLTDKNYDVKIEDLSLEESFDSLRKRTYDIEGNIIGLSSTSGFDYKESLYVASELGKRIDSTIIMGGQHAGPLGDIVFQDSNYVDAVVKYEGEWVLERILERNRKCQELFKDLPGVIFRKEDKIIENPGRPPIIKLDDLPFLDYELYPDFMKFTPFIEESRGCVYKCNYCTSNTINNSRIDIKNPKKFLSEVKACVNLFGKDKSYAVLASTYGVNPKWGKKIAEGMKKFGIKWNSEFRADSPWEYYISELLDSGYEVVNVGMESASPEILELMGKTNNPNKYIKKMSELIEVVESSDAVIRSNFMFYVGENPNTLRETLEFLQQNENMHSIQFSPLLIFHGTPVFNNFNEYRIRFGSEMVKYEYWDKRHLYPVHPSKYFSFEEVSTLGHVLEKLFSDEDAWCRAAKSLYAQENECEREKIKSSLRQARFRRK